MIAAYLEVEGHPTTNFAVLEHLGAVQNLGPFIYDCAYSCVIDVVMPDFLWAMQRSSPH